MTLQEVDRRIRQGREAIAKARAQGQDVKEWKEHLRRLEALRDRLAPAVSGSLFRHTYLYSDDDVTKADFPNNNRELHRHNPPVTTVLNVTNPLGEALARFKGFRRWMIVKVFSQVLGREVWVCNNPEGGGTRPDSHDNGYWLVDERE